MGRPIDPLSPYRVSVHKSNGHVYATTQPFKQDKNGNVVRRHVSWGVVIDSKFIPNKTYLYAAPEERAKLIFPNEWDMSAIKVTDTSHEEVRETFDLSQVYDYKDRFFGATWLLGKISDKLHIREDLLNTFDGNQEIVDDILSIAMFPYMTGYNLNRLEKWQTLEKYPSSRVLTSADISVLTQAITEQHRLKFLEARASRLGPDELLAVDSTTKTGWEDTLVNVRWGKNKEGLKLEVTVEAVIYTLTSHQPVYYRIFPGNTHDSKTIQVILDDLKEAGFKNVTLVTDRGYDSLYILDEYIQRGQKIIMCVKSGSGFAIDKIRELGEFAFVPDGFDLDAEKELYYRQYNIPYTACFSDGTSKKADRLKLNLYFDPVRRSAELKRIDISQMEVVGELDELIRQKAKIDDPESLQKRFPYVKLSFKTIPRHHWVEPHGKMIPIPEHKILQSYKRDDAAIAEGRKTAGFFSLITLGKDLKPMQALEQYSLRDEQEKYFSQMKTQMLCDRQRISSEAGKTGRAFIQFVGLIISSHLRYVWKTTDLKKLFNSSLEILDEMRSIRCIEYPAQNIARITPFIGKQVNICQAFGFEVPNESSVESGVRSMVNRKRGRPPGSKNKKKG